MKDKTHLLFYDGECGLCDQMAQFVLDHDKHNRFLFAPLQGETAKEHLPPGYRTLDSLSLIQDYGSPGERFYRESKGGLRIFWLLGGWWKLIGWLSFLPSFTFDWLYRLIARNRNRVLPECPLPDPKRKGRFLP
jgi:predicted DCC family thiol-disulfide oxidoreductase YuxK